MPQAQLPVFSPGATQINQVPAFEYRHDIVVYFQGTLPIFQHAAADKKSFYMITSQFYVNANATQSVVVAPLVSPPSA